MTSSVQSTAFQSSARPVDTFVRPPSVQPKTGIESLAETLAAVNPNLQRFIGQKIEENIEDQRADITMEIAKKGFKQITKEHRNKFGDDATNQLIGGSIFTQDEFEKRQAEHIGLTLNSDYENIYNNKVFEFTNREGKTITKPISHFSIDSPQMQEFLGEISSLTELKTQGLNNKHLANYFYPYQQKATEAIVQEHIKANNEFRFNRAKSQTNDAIWNALPLWLKGSKEEALNIIQKQVESQVTLGIPADKKTKFNDSIITSLKSISLSVYESALEAVPNDYESALDDAFEVIEMGGGIKIGPMLQQKDGTFSQSTLDKNTKYGTDMFNLKKSLYQRYEQDKKRGVDIEKAKEDKEILDFALEYGLSSIENIPKFNALIKKYPHRKPDILQKIEIYEEDRTKVVNDLMDQILNRQITMDAAATKFINIRNSLGTTITKEDEQNLEMLRGLIFDKTSGFDPYKNYRTDVREVLKRLGVAAGGQQTLDGYFTFNLEKEPDKADKYQKYSKSINRDLIDYLYRTIDPDNPGQFLKRSQEDYFIKLRDLEDAALKDIQSTTKNQNKGSQGVSNSASMDQILQFAEEKKLTAEQALNLLNTNKFTITPEGKIQLDKEVESGNFGLTGGNFFKKFFGGGRRGDGPGGGMMNEDTDDEPIKVQVRKGDTLFGLSQLYNTTVEKIKEVNGLASDAINIGQELIMPTITRLVNTVGDAVVPKEDLKNRSVLEEIDVTKPFSYDSLYRLAMEVGFPPEDARIMAAIALAESKGDAQIDTVASGTDPNKENEFSLGLWQINVIKEFQAERFPLFNIKSPQELYDPLTNAKAAFILYSRRKPKERFDDWSTYTDGTYKDFLPKTN
tara:strand:- start:10343 stop:12901 length:2559 start_codon:yes stop_codon:yes gene_type:complete